MPIQAPQWTDYLNCPVCTREFGAPPRSPISLGCGHTLCRHCLKHLHKKQCPFDQTEIDVDLEELVVNTALLQLAGYSSPGQPYHPPSIQSLSEADRLAYDVIVRSMERLATCLKLCGNASNNAAGSKLSRPMQRKLVTLLQCAVTDEEGRGRAGRAARSLGERTVTELILQHQNPQQLSANLWAAVRARGCQFLGPAMQEEVLKLVLLALEDGSALSRKVLVMFVVQRLEPHFPQASKTSIGHVVQLLYRASCFKVSKRESDSSLMQLKEEFRTYESLRREHDAQIVQIATEAGLRIAPDQWSALLYGDTGHKSHMQSIIDKLQTPQSFAQSVQELFIALQRTGDPAKLVLMSMHLDRLAGIDPSPDAKSPSWKSLSEIMTSLHEVVSGLVHSIQHANGRDVNHNNPPSGKHADSNTNVQSPQTGPATPVHSKYKVAMCRDAATRAFCPRGGNCTFAHTEEELERYRTMNTSLTPVNGYMPEQISMLQPDQMGMPQQITQAQQSAMLLPGTQPFQSSMPMQAIQPQQPSMMQQAPWPMGQPSYPLQPGYPMDPTMDYFLPQSPMSPPEQFVEIEDFQDSGEPQAVASEVFFHVEGLPSFSELAMQLNDGVKQNQYQEQFPSHFSWPDYGAPLFQGSGQYGDPGMCNKNVFMGVKTTRNYINPHYVTPQNYATNCKPVVIPHMQPEQLWGPSYNTVDNNSTYWGVNCHLPEMYGGTMSCDLFPALEDNNNVEPYDFADLEGQIRSFDFSDSATPDPLHKPSDMAVEDEHTDDELVEAMEALERRIDTEIEDAE